MILSTRSCFVAVLCCISVAAALVLCIAGGAQNPISWGLLGTGFGFTVFGLICFIYVVTRPVDQTYQGV